MTVSNKNVEETKADYVRPTYSGLYERIEDEKDVKPGMQVLLATTGGWVFDGVGGNPAYAHCSTSNSISFESYDDSEVWQDDTKFIYLFNKEAVILNVEQGAEGYDSSFVSFKAEFIIGGSRKYNHYFGENDEEDYDRRNDYDTIPWFHDHFGIRPFKDGKSTWELTYDSANKKMLMRKVNKTDDTSFLHYDYNGARNHFNFSDAYHANVNLYRKVDESELYDKIPAAPIVDPTKLTYHLGEIVDFSGMVAPFRIKRGEEEFDDYQIKYSDATARLFSNPPTIYTTNTEISVSLFGRVHVHYQITVETSTGSNNLYNRVNSLPVDLRGTYLLSDYRGRILDARSYSKSDSTAFNDGYLNATTEKLDASIIRIVRTKIDDTYYYHAQNVEGKYIDVDLSSPEQMEGRYGIKQVDTATVSNAITVTADTFRIGEYYLTDPGTLPYFCFTNSEQDIGYEEIHSYLFKLDNSTTFVNKQVSEYIANFLKQTEVCGDADETENPFDKISDELWANLATEFNNLGVDAQGIFANTTYTHGTAEPETKENIVDRYDYILAKYNKEDFMLRKLANTYANNYSNNAVIINMDNNSSIILVVVLSLVSLTAIGGLIVIKKRKHQ